MRDKLTEEVSRQVNSTSSLVIHKENMTFHQTIILAALWKKRTIFLYRNLAEMSSYSTFSGMFQMSADI